MTQTPEDPAVTDETVTPADQQPGTEPGADAPGARSVSAKRLIVSVFSVLVLLVGVGVGIAQWAGAFGSGDSAESRIEARINAMATAFNDHDVDGYFDSFCAQERVRFENLAAEIGLSRDDLFGDETISIDQFSEIVIEGDSAEASYEATVTDATGQSQVVGETARLVKEDGRWLVCS